MTEAGSFLEKVGQRARRLAKTRNWLPYVIYAWLSLAILSPLLLPGYILTLDMVFTPNVDYTSLAYGLDEWYPSASAPFLLLMQVVSKLIPTWLIQKAILFLVFFLAGLGAHKLFPLRGVGAYFAGLLYMINPFTYVRFLAGQWGVLAAYAMIPFAIKAFIDLLERRRGRDAIKVALLSTLVGLVQIHGFLLLFLAFLIIFLVKVIGQRREPAKILQASKYVGISAAMFLALNLYWLVPALTATGTVVEQISRQDLLFFAPKSTSTFGVTFDIASMYGFWRGGYLYAKDILPFWWLIFVFILFLAVYGFVARYRDRRLGWVVVSMATLAVVSFLLAVGAASGLTRPPFEWAWEHVPLFRAFRDSQKFVALLCLAYAFLGGLGVTELARGLRRQSKRLPSIGGAALVAIALFTPLAYSFTIFGFQGQLGTTDYPQGWYEVNEYLNQDEDDFNVLFLPWHLYMDYSWLPNRDKRLANPAWQFFDKPIIAGDNIEVPGIYSQSTNPISKYVEFLLSSKDDVENFGELLSPLNVKYVLLANEADYEWYDFLYGQAGLALALENEEIALFRNEHPIARAYGVNSMVYIENLEEYLELSQTQDVMEHLYILGGGTGVGNRSPMEKLDIVRKNPVKYQVEGSQRNYTIFTIPQMVSGEWEYNGQLAMKNLGFMPAFESDEEGGSVVYKRFYYAYLPSYIISLIALAFMAWYYFHRSRQEPS